MKIEIRSDLYKREKYLEKIRGFYHECEVIKVLTGVRRCGKSSIMNMIAGELLTGGVKEDNIRFCGAVPCPRFTSRKTGVQNPFLSAISITGRLGALLWISSKKSI